MLFFGRLKNLYILLGTLFLAIGGFIYALLYTTLPVYLLLGYLRIFNSIDTNVISTTGSLMSSTGINIETITVNNENINLKFNNINFTLSSSLNFKLNSIKAKISDQDIDIDDISGQIFTRGFYIYHHNNPIIWHNKPSSSNPLEFKHHKSTESHLSLDINKTIILNDSLPRVERIKIEGSFNSSGADWSIVLFTKTNKNTDESNINLSGHTQHKNYIPYAGSFKVFTKAPIKIVDNNEARIHGLPEINIKILNPQNNLYNTLNNSNKLEVDIDGLINITQGIIKPYYQTKLKITDDIEFINEKDNDVVEESTATKSNTETNMFNIKLTTHIKLSSFSKKLEFKTKDLKTKLQGEVDLYYHHDTNSSSMRPLAQGEINLIDGVYRLYGHPLKITQGSLLYSNNPIDNPRIKLIGEREVNLVHKDRSEINKLDNDESNPEAKLAVVTKSKVGINITGDINNPVIKLFSDELMSETDQISYLLFGIPSFKINEAHGQILLQTAKQLFGDNEDYVTISNELKELLSIDEFDIINKQVTNPVTGHYENQPTIMLGKKFFGNLLLRYGFNIINPVSTVTAEYKIRDNLSLTAKYDSQSASSADIVYFKETDRLL